MFGAAFARENSLGSLYNRVFGDGVEGRFYWHPDKVGDDGKRNIDYDAWGQIQGTPYEDSYPEFFWVSNDAEAAQVKARLDREFKREQILSESGGLGLVAGLTAGVLDPMNLIPVGGAAVKLSRLGGSLLRGAGTGARAGLLGGAATEAALQATQDTRTWEESAVNIGAGAILAGALGGGISGLRHRVQKKAEADQVGRLHDAVKADPTATQGRNADDAVELEIANEKAGLERVLFDSGAVKDDGMGNPALKPNGEIRLKTRFGMAKIVARHGELGPDAALPDRAGFVVTRDDVTALPEVLRKYEPHVSKDGEWEYLVERLGADGKKRQVLYVVRNFSRGDGNNHVVTVFVPEAWNKSLPPLSQKRHSPIHKFASSLVAILRDTTEVLTAKPSEGVGRGVPSPSIKQSTLGDNPPTREDLEEAIERDLTFGVRARSTTPPEGEPDPYAPVPPAESSVGAKMAQETSLEDEGLAGTFGVGEAVAWADPLNRSLHSPSVVMRRVTQQLAEIPLTLAKNARGLVTGVDGGSVETRIKVRQAPLMQALKRMDDLYIQYRKGRARRMGDLAVQGVQDLINRTEGKLTRKGFYQAIGEAMRRGDTHAVPEVAEAARLYRQEVFEPLKDDAIKLGLLPEDVEVKTAASYLMRQYNFEKIAAQRPEFKRVIAQWLGEEQGKKAAIQERVQAVFAEVEEVKEALRQTQEEIVTQKSLIDAPDSLPEVIAPGTVLSGDLIGQFYRRFIRGSKVQGPLKATPFFEIADVDPRALAEAARLSPAFANAPQTFRISAIALKHAWDSRVKGKVPVEMINDLFDNVGNILKAPDEVLPNPREGSEDTVLFVQKVNTHGRDRDVFAVVEVGADGKFLEIKTVIGPHSKSSLWSKPEG